MTKFSAGQKVVCIDSSETAGKLVCGNIYEVMYNDTFNVDGGMVKLTVGYFNHIRFTLLDTTQIPNMKFIISNEPHSRTVQEALFAIGCKWWYGDIIFDNMIIRYLYVMDSEISYYNNSEFFDEHEFDEYRLNMGKFVKVEPYTEDVDSVEKPPVGLSSRVESNHFRIADILNAMVRYHDAKLAIPQEWIDELSIINSEKDIWK